MGVLDCFVHGFEGSTKTKTGELRAAGLPTGLLSTVPVCSPTGVNDLNFLFN